MNTPKFTPGPWSVPHFATPEANCECNYILCDSLLGAVCSVYCSGEGDDWKSHGDNPKFEQACANAHLIAAAPDLFYALLGLIDEHEEFFSSVDKTETISNARKAIAKALGQDQS